MFSECQCHSVYLCSKWVTCAASLLHTKSTASACNHSAFPPSTAMENMHRVHCGRVCKGQSQPGTQCWPCRAALYIATALQLIMLKVYDRKAIFYVEFITFCLHRSVMITPNSAVAIHLRCGPLQ